MTCPTCGEQTASGWCRAHDEPLCPCCMFCPKVTGKGWSDCPHGEWTGEEQ